MVEFVLISSILFLILFAIIDFGLLLNTQLVMTSAAREGARKAAVDGGASTAALERINQHLSLSNIPPNAAEVTIEPKVASFGRAITVSIMYEYRFKTPIISSLVGEGVKLHAQVISRSEKVR